MPPDFTPYIDITPQDITAETAYLGAIELAQLVIPEFQLRQGTVEDAIFQAMAYMSMLNVAAINRLPSRLMVGMAKLIGITPDEGQRSVLRLAINLYAGETSTTLPARTVFTYTQTIEGQRYEYAFETIQDETITSTSPSTPDIITAYSRLVGVHPTPTEGETVTLISVNSAIENVTVATTAQASPNAYFYAGSNEETDETYLARCASVIKTLNSTICTAQQLRNYILTNYADVSKCKVYDLMQTSTRLLDAGGAQTETNTEAGHMYVMLYGLDGNLSGARKTEITANILDRSVAGMLVNVADPDVLDITGLSVSFVFDNQYDQAEIEQEVKDVVAYYLSPAGFDTTKESVFIYVLSSLVNSIEGVKYVTDITFDLTGMNSTLDYYADGLGNLWFRRAGMMPSLLVADITAVGSVT